MTVRTASLSVVAVSRGAELAGPEQPRQRGPEHQALEVFIGKWINEGRTVASPGMPAMSIVTSDICEWAPGGFHVVHSAYGRLAGTDVGGTGIITYDPTAGHYRTYFFDSQGNTSTHRLTVDGDTWRWQGETTRCTAIFTDDGKVQTARHERTDDGGATWLPSMTVTLTKIQ
jgi:hypothetical protein